MKLRHLFLCAAPVCLVLVASSALRATVQTVDNGLVNVFNSTEDPNTGFLVANDGVNPTTVQLVTGGEIVGDSFTEIAFEFTQDSIFDMDGGTTVFDVILTDNSTGTIDGGSIGIIEGGNLTADGNATVTINNVTASDDVEAVGNSFIEIFDGTFVEDVQAEGTALIRIHGGQFMVGGPDSRGGFIEPAEDGVIEILGGTFGVGAASDPNWAGSVVTSDNSKVIIKGGTHNGGGANFTDPGEPGDPGDWPFGLADLLAQDDSTIEIHGSAFQVNGSFVSPGTIPNIAGDVSGLLADGTPFDLSFNRDLTGSIVLVPEPAAISLTLIGLIGLASRRRK